MTTKNTTTTNFFGPHQLPPSTTNSTVSDTEATTTEAGGVSPSSSESSSEEKSEAEGPSVTVEEKEGPPPMLSALDAFEEVEGPPAFLDPEAIRPVHVVKPRKRKLVDANEEAEKKLCPTVIAAKALTYETPRDPTLPPPTAKEKPEKGTSKAMPVDAFLTKGGGAMLPRKTRMQRDKEKAKREKGQSSHPTWKSEEEMLLRQQFDS